MQMVPKKIIFIWVGPPIPDKYIENIKRWQAKNPDYEVNLWTDTATTHPDFISQAEEKNKLLASHGVKIRNLSSNDKALLAQAFNEQFYMDEVTGEDANFAAASDILRLEILAREGGVYIDTDTEPTNERLGDIVVNDCGFAKPAGPTNDVLCATPGSPMIDDFRKQIRENYVALYNTKQHVQLNQAVDMHRSIKPWKARLETTLDWTGPGAMLPVIQKKYIEPLLKEGGMERATQFVNQIFVEDLSKRFNTKSDKTWLDKGPQNINEANQYFKAEFKFRLRHSCIKQIKNIINKDARYAIMLNDLVEKLALCPRDLPLSSVFNDWKKDKPEKVVNLVSKSFSFANKTENLINDIYIDDEAYIKLIKVKMFPINRYSSLTKDIDLTFAASISTMEQVYNELRSIIGSHPQHIFVEEEKKGFFSKFPWFFASAKHEAGTRSTSTNTNEGLRV